MIDTPEPRFKGRGRDRKGGKGRENGREGYGKGEEGEENVDRHLLVSAYKSNVNDEVYSPLRQYGQYSDTPTNKQNDRQIQIQ